MLDDAYPHEPPPDEGPPDNVEHLAPHNLDAEQIVIGSALMSPTTYQTLARQLQPTDFYLPNHETIWTALADLAALEHPTEPTALLAHLREKRLLNKISGTYIHSCYEAGTLPAAAAFYARDVLQLARRRRGLQALQVAQQRLRNPGPDHDTDETLRNVSEALTQSVEAIADPNPTTSWAPLDLEQALAGNSLDPPPDILARTDGICLFYSGGVHAIAGESESGKTWVTLYAAVQLMTAALNVVFIDFEDRPERVIGRLLSLGATPDEIRKHFHYVRPDRPLNSVGQHELQPHLEHAVLVIIDGITEAMTVHGLDLNSNADAATFYSLLPRWIADHGPAVAMIDHVVKDKEKQGRYALGAQHKLAGIDAASYTVKVITPFGRGKRGLARIDVAKDRPGHVREHAIGSHIAEFTIDDTNPGGMIATLDPPPEHPTTEDGSWAPTIVMEKLSKYVYGNPNASTRTIFDAVAGKDQLKRQALEILIQRGHISVSNGPRNARLHHHETHFPPRPEDTE